MQRLAFWLHHVPGLLALRSLVYQEGHLAKTVSIPFVLDVHCGVPSQTALSLSLETYWRPPSNFVDGQSSNQRRVALSGLDSR